MAGGGKSKVSGAIDAAFAARGWKERKFRTQIRVDENVIESPTHKVDCFKNGGLEFEPTKEKTALESLRWLGEFRVTRRRLVGIILPDEIKIPLVGFVEF